MKLIKIIAGITAVLGISHFFYNLGYQVADYFCCLECCSNNCGLWGVFPTFILLLGLGVSLSLFIPEKPDKPKKNKKIVVYTTIHDPKNVVKKNKKLFCKKCNEFLK